jgi:quercetin dioxygenase-like cupin family protein
MMADPILVQCSLEEEIERLAPRDNEAGRRAEILVKHDQLRVTLVTVRAGIELSEHSAPVPLTFQVLRGRFEFEHSGERLELGSNDFLSLRENVDHRVRAIEDGAFLLTLGWSAG